MKLASNIVGGLLGLLFIAFACMVLFKLVDMPPPPEGSPAGHFMAAFGPTGYMTFVKVFELLGGVLVAIPLTRNLGLLVLGPILVNIIAFHLFVAGGVAGLLDPVLITLCLMAVFLLWAERGAWKGLLKR